MPIDDVASRTAPFTADELPIDAVVVPVGGGGLISGVATVFKALAPHVRVVGAEPAEADDAARSKAAGALLGNEHVPTTVADGLRTMLGSNTWPVVRDRVDEIITVSEEDIVAGMHLVWTRAKVVIEPSAGVGIAALHSPAMQDYRRVAVVLCGGNVDFSTVPLPGKV